MADQADIENVKDLLPAEAETEGWDDAKIAVYLDGDRTVFQVVQTYWESKSSKLYAMIDVSESGSSRSLSKIYENAKGQAEYWRDRAQTEKDEIEKEAGGRIAFHRITRV